MERAGTDREADVADLAGEGDDGSVHLGDYFGPAVMPRGNMVVVFPLALTPPSGTTLHENMYTVRGGLPIGRRGRP